MQVKCTGCHHSIEFEDLARPKIMNTAGVSLALLEHAQQMYCPHCEKTVAIFVAGVTVALAAAPVAPEEQKRLIVVPGMQG